MSKYANVSGQDYYESTFDSEPIGIDLENEPAISLAVALGDHNFPDLKEFVLGKCTAPADKEMVDITVGAAAALNVDVQQPSTIANPEDITVPSLVLSHLQGQPKIHTHPSATISHVLTATDPAPSADAVWILTAQKLVAISPLPAHIMRP